jgi:hypothetical protein
MTGWQNAVESGFRYNTTQTATQFTHNGQTYACTVSYSDVSEVALALGGSEERYDATIQVLLSLFTGPPKVQPRINDELLLEGATLVVAKEPFSTAGVPFLTLKCNRLQRADTPPEDASIF